MTRDDLEALSPAGVHTVGDFIDVISDLRDRELSDDFYIVVCEDEDGRIALLNRLSALAQTFAPPRKEVT